MAVDMVSGSSMGQNVSESTSRAHESGRGGRVRWFNVHASYDVSLVCG